MHACYPAASKPRYIQLCDKLQLSGKVNQLVQNLERLLLTVVTLRCRVLVVLHRYSYRSLLRLRFLTSSRMMELGGSQLKRNNFHWRFDQML